MRTRGAVISPSLLRQRCRNLTRIGGSSFPEKTAHEGEKRAQDLERRRVAKESKWRLLSQRYHVTPLKLRRGRKGILKGEER